MTRGDLAGVGSQEGPEWRQKLGCGLWTLKPLISDPLALLRESRKEAGRGDLVLITPASEILFLKWLPSLQEENDERQ